ncbi:S41 family peptidase [Zobellia uliginosa]|uniref:S41 family peptidase n=1 Tax=Zobellia uliginosa TaxID=143224 RepID=UPI0026E2A40E|nr:S41 family peptidase [Zobellia uliginosa]MDO6518568.1 S41 family peptidase [Zobellia uliginosa]
MIKKATTVLLILFIGCSPKSDLPDIAQKIENLKTFSKIYGYIKYFHPSDEAFRLDWDKFSIYAANKVLKCETNEAFVKTIDTLFSPIAPSIRFSNSKGDTLIVKKSNNSDVIGEQFWFHQGVGYGMSMQNGPYYSQRIIATSENDSISFRPKYGETTNVSLNENQYLSIPLVVNVDEQGTIPISSKKRLESLITDLNHYKIDESSISFRLGNIINTYNVFQHFFPYFDVLKLDWENELESALIRSFKDSSLKDHLITLRKFTSPLKDGHISINAKGVKEGLYTPPFYWEWVGDKLIISDVWEDDLNLKNGDEVIKINGVSSKEYFEEVNSMISAGTVGWLRHKSEELSLLGEQGSKITIETTNQTIEVTRNQKPYSHVKSFKPYTKIDKGIHYLNLSLLDMETFNYLLPQLEKSTGLIFDLRGYPNGNGEIINHLMKVGDTTKAWMYIPKIVYPDQQKPKSYLTANWKGFFEPALPYLGDKKVVILTDGKAISYAESLIGFVKGYKLATIVGQPTAGTNGNFNTFNLPGEIKIKWTGMKVVKHDGSQLYGIGVLPDVYVQKTVQGIKEGRDVFLEKAIEIVR